jgi:hypothetical protein
MPDKEHLLGSIRSRYRDIDVALAEDHPEKAYAQYLSLAPATPLGHFQVTVSTVAVGLPSLPAEARKVLIFSKGQPLNFRDDGTAPTAGTGFPIPSDTVFVYDNDVSSTFQMILDSTATGDADVRIAYYG